MTRWLRRFRGALGLGLTWAVGWALGGVLIGVTSLVLPWLPWGTFFRVFDAPLPALGVPGFVGGIVFSVVLGIAGRRQRFDTLSLARFTAWGALGGALLCFIPATLLVTTHGGGSTDLLRAIGVIIGPFTLLGAVSAAASLAIARRAEDRELFLEGLEANATGLTEGEARALLGRSPREQSAAPMRSPHQR